MAITDEDLAYVRTFVTWDPPTDDTLSERFDALGSRESVAEWFVRERLSRMIDDPESFSIPGDYQESWGANIIALRESLKVIGATVPGAAFGVTRAVRVGGSDFR